MNKSRLLWILVAANIMFTFASVGAEAFFGWTLPPSLARYTHGRFTDFSMAGVGQMFHLLLLATTAAGAFAAWIGLLSYWRFARPLYLVTWACSILLILLSGPSVRTSVGAMFRAMDALVAGAIIGLVYFSDLAHRFERAPIDSAVPAGMNVSADRA
jgi:hypothetical protein